MNAIVQVLRSRPYPGRGCLAARTGNGTLALLYFLTGRSPASQGRELKVLDNGDIAVQDITGAATHDALRHYVAAARRDGWTVVGNGEQVVPLADALSSGLPVTTAWEQHTFEPDPPVHTSRIWVARRAGGPGECILGYARRSTCGDGDADRVAWTVGRLDPGAGILMTTYDGTADAVRATWAPAQVQVGGSTVEDVLQEVWVGLDPGLRVAAFAVTPDDDTPPLTIR
jgi:IMP cyclohydrolase